MTKDEKVMAGSVTRFRHTSLQRGPTPTIIEITQPSASAKRLSIMAVQCGIVGLPNVGKSTLFNALTKAGIAAENYPFCTIGRTAVSWRCRTSGSISWRTS